MASPSIPMAVDLDDTRILRVLATSPHVSMSDLEIAVSVARSAGQPVGLGVLAASLVRLADGGLVDRVTGPNVSSEGRQFRITPLGRTVVLRARRRRARA